MTATLNPTNELLSHDDFRAALQDAIKGREAKNASFSKAWADVLVVVLGPAGEVVALELAVGP